MAILFTANSGTAVNFGQAASLDTIATGTLIVTFTKHEMANSLREVCSKNLTGAPNGWNLFTRGPAPEQIEFTANRATQAQRVRSPTGTVILNKPIFVAVTWNIASGGPKLYYGYDTMMAREGTTDVLDGSGTQVNDDTSNLQFGARDGATSSGVGGLGFFLGLWTRNLTLGEIQQVQRRQTRRHVVVPPGCVLWCELGESGTSQQTDRSGAGNHGAIVNSAVWAPTPAHLFRYQRTRTWVQLGGTVFTIDPAGAIVPTSLLAFSTSKAIAGAVQPSGALSKSALLAYAGSLTPSGATSGQTAKALSGALTPTGDTTKSALLSYAGSLDPSGGTANQTGKSLSGTLTPTSASVRDVASTYSGSLTPISSAMKDVSANYAGSITPSGVLSVLRAVLMTFTGALTPAGAMVRDVAKSAAGTLASSGAIVRDMSAVLRGSLTPTGSLGKLISKFWSGLVGLVGSLTSFLPGAPTPSQIEITGSYIPSIAFTGVYQTTLTATGTYSPTIAITGSIE